MSEVLQEVVATGIVAVAVVFTVRALLRAVDGKKSTLTACAGCKLRDVCQKTEKNSAKKCAEKVAQVKK